MKENPLLKVKSLGQSVWLDFVDRVLIESGELERLVNDDGVSGVTSNPKIFDKAIEGHDIYDDDIRRMAEADRAMPEIYEALAVHDIQAAADVLRPEFDRVKGRDGFVSIEVNPHLAHDTDGTIAEVRRLWKAVDRPNVLIKIPGTQEGLPAIRRCLSEGINVNITLLFGLPRYRNVAEAYIGALEDRVQRNESIDSIASVASFFLSRIDVLVDPKLEDTMKGKGPKANTAKELRGEVAIASARQAYQIYKEVFGGDGFAKLAKKGANTQRVLWASTSTKNPDYSDVRYVDALIGPETVNTLPPDTLDAYRDHGKPESRLETELDKAEHVLNALSEVGIDIDAVTQQLEDEGVDKFEKPYDALLESLKKKSKAISNAA